MRDDRERRGKKQREKKEQFSLVLEEPKKRRVLPTPLDLSLSFFLASALVPSMRLKKRPRLLLCAPRRPAMPLLAPPPLSNNAEENEDELKSGEEEEGLPCADAAARVKEGRREERGKTGASSSSPPLVVRPPPSRSPLPLPPLSQKNETHRQATPAERSWTSSAAPSRRSLLPLPPPLPSEQPGSVKEKRPLRRRSSRRPRSPPQPSRWGMRSTPLPRKTRSGRSTTTSTAR